MQCQTTALFHDSLRVRTCSRAIHGIECILLALVTHCMPTFWHKHTNLTPRGEAVEATSTAGRPRIALNVHSTPCRRFYFLQIEIEVSIRWSHPADTSTKLSRFRFSLPSALTWLEHGGGGRMEAALHDGADVFC